MDVDKRDERPVAEPKDSGRSAAGQSTHNPGAEAPERLGSDDADEQPTIASQSWLKDDDYWQRTTYIAITGRHTAAPQHTRPIPRPKRFRKASTARSAIILLLMLALIGLIPVGIIVAQRVASSRLTLPTSIPGFSEPSPTLTPLPTLHPTSTPPKKK